MKKAFFGLFILTGLATASPALAETTTTTTSMQVTSSSENSQKIVPDWQLKRLDTNQLLGSSAKFEPGSVILLAMPAETKVPLYLLDAPEGIQLQSKKATDSTDESVSSLLIPAEVKKEFLLTFVLGTNTKTVKFQPVTTLEVANSSQTNELSSSQTSSSQSDSSDYSERSSTTTSTTNERSSESSSSSTSDETSQTTSTMAESAVPASSSSTGSFSSTSSTTPSATEGSKETANVTISAVDGHFPVSLHKVVSPEELLQLVSYTGDKSKLKITITDTDYVYVTPDAEVYHYDLNGLLPKTRPERVSVLTEQQARDKGRRLATEVSDKTIEKINCTLAGKYHVTFSDGIHSAESTVTVGDPVAASQAGDQLIKNVQSLASAALNRSSSTPASISAPQLTPISFATPSSSVAVQPTTAKMIPQFGDKANPYSVLGLGLLLTAGTILIKEVRKQPKS